MLSISIKKKFEVTVIVFNLCINLGIIDILSILFLAIHEHGISHNLFIV